MAVERTYAMIKPHIVRDNKIGKVVTQIEEGGFTIVAMKKMQMSQDLAKLFYEVHSQKPFYQELVDSITSGPIVAMVLEKDGVIAGWREFIGATNPENAEEGTLRQLYGTSILDNVVHGSDAPATAETEIKLIFPEL